MMFIFYRYVIREHVAPFFLAFSVIMFVLVLKLMLDLADVVISKSIPLMILAKLFVYNLAWMVALVVPMSVLVASVMAFGRLGSSGEIVAMKSAGISMYRIVAPLLLLAALLTAGMIWFNNEVLPQANYRSRNLQAAVAFYRPTLSLKNREGQFVSDIPDVTVRVESINYKTDDLYGITLFRNSNGIYQDIITAKSGRFITDEANNRMVLALVDGQIHHFNPEQPVRYVWSDYHQFFQNYTINLGFEANYQAPLSDRTMSSRQLNDNIGQERAAIAGLETDVRRLPADRPGYADQVKRLHEEIDSRERTISKYKVEIHKKYSIPFASMIFVLLGASLGILVRRSGASIGIGLSIGFFTLYYLALIGGESAGDRMLIAPWIGMWAPNIVLGALGIYMLVYAARR